MVRVWNDFIKPKCDGNAQFVIVAHSYGLLLHCAFPISGFSRWTLCCSAARETRSVLIAFGISPYITSDDELIHRVRALAFTDSVGPLFPMQALIPHRYTYSWVPVPKMLFMNGVAGSHNVLLSKPLILRNVYGNSF